MIEGAVVLIVGMLLGVPIGALVGRRRTYKAPPPVKPICSCLHTRGKHRDGGKGHCNVTTVTVLMGMPLKDGVTCPCTFYDGPVPLPEYYAPEIISE